MYACFSAVLFHLMTVCYCVCLQWVTAARLALPVASHFRVQLFFTWQIKYDDDDDDDDD